MHLFEHPDAGVHLAQTREEAMESMGQELPACERDPERITQIPDDALVTVENEEGETETKTAREWAAEAQEKEITGFIFGNYTIQAPVPVESP